MITLGPIFHLKIIKLSWDGRGSMARVEDMLQIMMRRFDASDEHAKEFRGDLANIGQKVNAHAVSIKHLE